MSSLMMQSTCHPALVAVAYIDDRGIRFTSWDQALADLAAHEG